jgi:hypothetical protein
MAQEADRSALARAGAGGEPIHVAAQHGDQVALVDCLSSGVSAPPPLSVEVNEERSCHSSARGIIIASFGV